MSDLDFTGTWEKPESSKAIDYISLIWWLAIGAAFIGFVYAFFIF